MNNSKTFRIVLSAVIMIAFFLPWLSLLGSSINAWNIAMQSTAGEPNQVAVTIVKYSFLLIPLFALIILIRSAMGLPSGFFLRLLPFLVTVILISLFVLGVLDEKGTTGTLSDWMHIFGIGFYGTLAASFLLLFV
jgi:hypothetical protein